jgi:hypothetical protein
MSGELMGVYWWKLEHILDLLSLMLKQTGFCSTKLSWYCCWTQNAGLCENDNIKDVFVFVKILQFIPHVFPCHVFKTEIILGTFTKLMWCPCCYFGLIELRIIQRAKSTLSNHMNLAGFPRTCPLLWREKEGPVCQLKGHHLTISNVTQSLHSVYTSSESKHHPKILPWVINLNHMHFPRFFWKYQGNLMYLFCNSLRR